MTSQGQPMIVINDSGYQGQPMIVNNDSAYQV